MTRSSKDKEIESWLAGLRDEPIEESDSFPFREGNALRQLFLARRQQQAEQPDPSQQSEIAHWHSILDQARHAGIFTRPRRSSWWRLIAKATFPLNQQAASRAAYATSATLAILAIGLVMLLSPQLKTPEAESIVWRGVEKAQVLHTDQPQRLANEVMGTLSKHQIKARRIDHQNEIEIQAKIPPEALSARSELQQLGIVIPDHGRLFVRLLKP